VTAAPEEMGGEAAGSGSWSLERGMCMDAHIGAPFRAALPLA
jgi:hypothetical protein